MEDKLKHFYEFLLDLDYFKDIASQQFNEEKDKEEVKEEKQQDELYSEVALEYVDHIDYIKVWEPLWLLECKANIFRAI